MSMSAVAGTTVQERAMLVDLTIKQWAVTKTDKGVSSKVAADYSATNDPGHYSKHLLAKDKQDALSEVSKVAGRIRAFHYEKTSPWLDNGARILSAANFFDYDTGMRALESEWNSAVDRFVADYPQLVNERARELNGLFDASDYPHPGDIAGRFRFQYRIYPIPVVEDFRVDLGDEVTQRVYDKAKADMDESFRNVTADAYGRMLKTVGHMVTKLKEYTGKRDGSFRDSLVENVREMVEFLPTLNVTDDADITAVIARIKSELTVHNADTLRVSEVIREQTQKSAESIMADIESKMSAFI